MNWLWCLCIAIQLSALTYLLWDSHSHRVVPIRLKSDGAALLVIYCIISSSIFRASGITTFIFTAFNRRQTKWTQKHIHLQMLLWLPKFWTWFSKPQTTSNSRKERTKPRRRWIVDFLNSLLWLLMLSRWKFFFTYPSCVKTKMFRMSLCDPSKVGLDLKISIPIQHQSLHN